MTLLYRIMIKAVTMFRQLLKLATIEVAKSNGLTIGQNFYVEGVPNFGSEPFLITFGDYVTIAEGVSFINHGGDARVTKRIEKYKDARLFGRIKVGSNVFIGKGAVLLPGVSVGNNCIIGSLSLVTSSVPDNSVYAGAPAKFICTIEEYGEKSLKKTTKYPLELEKSRKELESYLKENLPYDYKSVRK